MSRSNPKLLEVLQRAQVVGDLGGESTDVAIAQSMRFVEALPSSISNVADLGSGAGIPGLVIALERPEIEVRLVERSQKRADGLELAIRKLEISNRVTVWCGDSRDVARDPMWPGPVDAVVCRSFSPISELFDAAEPLLALRGILVTSEPPGSDGSRWIGKTPPRAVGPKVSNGTATFLLR